MPVNPDEDLGVETPEVVETPETETPETPEVPDGPGSGRSDIRKSLEKGFKDRRTADEAAERDRKGKFRKGGTQIGAARTEEAPEIAEGEEPEAPEQPQTAAPEAFSKEAKAEWAKVPSTVQAAVLKREADVAKGVEELKGRYRDIDAALAPHLPAIRQHGHTPGQAVNQLFAWFQALGTNPDVAFPALAKSFGWGGPRAAAEQPVQPDGSQPEGEVSPAVQKYINDMQTKLSQIEQTFGQQLTGLTQTFQQQSEQKTNEILANWSKDKPHFESVRQLMAQLIQSGATPLKNGQVDLDGAYDMALYANPEIRKAVLAEQQKAAVAARKVKAAADLKAQEEAAVKARRAGTSLGGGAPGEAGPAQPGKRGKGLSVRESLMAAREELSS